MTLMALFFFVISEWKNNLWCRTVLSSVALVSSNDCEPISQVNETLCHIKVKRSCQSKANGQRTQVQKEDNIKCKKKLCSPRSQIFLLKTDLRFHTSQDILSGQCSHSF